MQDTVSAPKDQTPDVVRYDAFLCHNRREKPLVKDIADALQSEAGMLFFSMSIRSRRVSSLISIFARR